MALQVEKTSKRGGRIIHEKEMMPPPPPTPVAPVEPKEEPSITEIMRSPSKVVLLRVSVVPKLFITYVWFFLKIFMVIECL